MLRKTLTLTLALAQPLALALAWVENADVGVREELRHARAHLSDGGEEALVERDGEVAAEEGAHLGLGVRVRVRVRVRVGLGLG